MKNRLSLLLVTLTATIFATKATTLYVGDAKGDYPTISAALNHARGELATSDVRIEVRSGLYPIANSINLPATDSNHSLTIAADGEVTLFGGSLLKQEWFTPLPKGDFADKLVDKDAAKHIVVCDLKKHGVKNLGEITPHGWSKTTKNHLPPAMLTIGGKRMTLSRWPNIGEDSPYIIYKHYLKSPRELKGYERLMQRVIDKMHFPGEVGIDAFVEPGTKYHAKKNGPALRGGVYRVKFDRMKYWNNPSEIFVDGVLGSTWEWTYNQIESIDLNKREIKLQQAEISPLGEANSTRLPHMHYENIPEELNQAGEYYIDREAGKLYLYPTESFATENIILSTLDKPMIAGKGVKNTTIEGITFDSGRHLAIEITEAKGVVIDNCTISNFVKGAIDLSGTQSIVKNSTIYGIGAYGIFVKGGDMKRIAGGGNTVSNCKIYDFGWDQKSQMPGVMVEGVAHRVEHCDISNGTHFGIKLRQVCDAVVEYNEIHDLPTYHFFDGGALYHASGTNPHFLGNEVRFNHFHDIPTIGVYPDNYTWGDKIHHNLFERVGNVSCRPAVYVNGGGYVRTYNNIIVDAPILYGQGRHFSALSMRGRWLSLMEQYGDGKVEATPYAKYDNFKAWLQDKDIIEWLHKEPHTQPDKALRTKSYVYNNLYYHPNSTIFEEADENGVLDRSTVLDADNNYETTSDPGFVDAKAGNYNLKSKNSAPKGFEPLPIDKMGLLR